MTDDIYSHNEQNRKKRGNESREEKNDGKKKQKFYINKSDWYKEEKRKRSFCDEKHYHWYDRLYEDDKEKNRCETEKFPKNKIPSFYWFWEDKIHSFPFYFSKKKLTSYENNGNNSENLYHSESEIHDNLIGLTEWERSKYERKTDKCNPEKNNHVKYLVSGKFTKSIESYIEHKK